MNHKHSDPLPIPLATPTFRSLLEEAASLWVARGASRPPVDALIADAEEMLLARADVRELSARGYEVTDGMFDRLELLLSMLSPEPSKDEV
jgi:hypothetical protein